MKSLLVAAVLLGSSTVALAQDNLPAGYAEIAVGGSFIPTVSTKTYTFTNGTDTATGKINLDYNSAFTVGGEIGVAGVGMPEIRLGLGYDYLQARFSSGEAIGTVNGTPGTLSFTRSDLSSIGVRLDNNVQVLSGNIYYSFPLVATLRPYVGFGVGSAFIQNADTQLAITASAGFRMAISDEAYLGLRYRYYNINGPTDDFGIQYNNIQNHSIMVLLGMYMN